jgi:hypothetical protein
MATSSQLNLLVDQGSTFVQTFKLVDAEGTAIDLSQYDARGQYRKSYASTAYGDLSVTVVDSINGVIEISLTAAQTEAIAAGRYVYDVEIFTEAGVIYRVLRGEMEVTPEVTRIADP